MSTPEILVIAILLLCVLGVALARMLPERKNPRALAWIGVLASLLVLWFSGQTLLTGQSVHTRLWRIEHLGRLTLEMDRLSALFLFVTGLVYLPVSIFSARYLEKYLGRYSLKTFAVYYHLLLASIVLTLIAADVLTFLVAWEAMSLACYLLVSYEHEQMESTRAGFLMLAMSEAGTVAVVVALLVLAGGTGAIGFDALRTASGQLGGSARWAVFLLLFFGFGVKAGLVPTSTWLPRAHPIAPGNVSALLSGVILNLGIYGIVRGCVDLFGQPSVASGLVVLSVGSLSALIGILYATTENDLKTMLAHSSIENMGIIVAGLGAGMVFLACEQPALAGIAFIAAFYHAANHSVYKALLFLGAGAVDMQAGTRDMNRLGGLIRRMPWTAFLFLVGALAIAALPPLNGFVSEWLTLQSLLGSAVLSSVPAKIVFALCGAGLALTAALAITCFVKAFGMSFLGPCRSKEAEAASESSRSLRFAMGWLAAGCIGLGVLPTYVIPVLSHTASPLVHAEAVDELVPPFFLAGAGGNELDAGFVSEFHDLGAQVGRGILPGRGLVVLHRGTERNPVVFAMSTSYTAVVLVLLVGVTFALVRLGTRHRATQRRTVWDGGIRRLLPEMTYTATGFSNPIRVIFEGIFRPARVEEIRETIAEHFRTAIKNGHQTSYIVDRMLFQPIVRAANKLAVTLARLHSGPVNAYAAYVLLALLAALVLCDLF